MTDPIHQTLEELRREVREGHASLHVRHDNHDQQLGHAHHKLDTVKKMLVAVFKADGKAFMDAWRGR